MSNQITKEEYSRIVAFLSADFTRYLRENPDTFSHLEPNTTLLFKVRGVPWAEQFNRWTDRMVKACTDDYPRVVMVMAVIEPVYSPEFVHADAPPEQDEPLRDVRRSPREYEPVTTVR
jgi:hypothetical protein